MIQLTRPAVCVTLASTYRAAGIAEDATFAAVIASLLFSACRACLCYTADLRRDGLFVLHLGYISCFRIK